jgi:hypothetical protein
MKVIPTSLGGARQLVDDMRRDLHHATPEQLREVERTAAVMKSVFWDSGDVRESALGVATLAGACLRKGVRQAPR